MRNISLDHSNRFGEGRTGEVYRIDDETVVKLYYEGKAPEQIAQENELARKALILGVPTAISFDTVQCDGRIGVVYELLNADTLAKVLSEDTDGFDAWTTKYAELAFHINSIETSDPSIPSAKDWYANMIRLSDKWLSAGEQDACFRLLETVPDCNRLIHGDLHTKNIILQNGELITIDMADMSRGHPVFDLAANYLTFQLASPPNRLSGIGLTGELSDRVFHDFILKYFSAPNGLSQGQRPDASLLARRMKDIATFGMLKLTLSPAIAPNIPQQHIDSSLGFARKYFFPQIDSLIAGMALDW